MLSCLYFLEHDCHYDKHGSKLPQSVLELLKWFLLLDERPELVEWLHDAA